MVIKSIQIFNDISAPYGFYQIRKCYEDGSFWVVCYIDNDLKKTIDEMVRIIAASYGVEIIDMREIPGIILK